jgi:protein-S-isoprenylcysteine O-methyltransferase
MVAAITPPMEYVPMHRQEAAIHLAFLALSAIWLISEIWLGWRRRSGDRGRSRDHGTLRVLLWAIYASMGLAIWLSLRGPGHIVTGRAPLFWLGLLLMATGMGLRFWAIRVLARFFTVDVSIREGHTLIRRGPYRWLRIRRIPVR